MAKKIEDFGEKIGAARKDLWKGRGLSVEDTYEMTEAEKKKFVTRDNVWPLPDAKKQVNEEGVEPAIAYWMRKVRTCIPKEPRLTNVTSAEQFDEKIERYINAINDLKKSVEGIKTVGDANTFYFEMFRDRMGCNRYAEVPEWAGVISTYDVRRLSYRLTDYRCYCGRTGFPFSNKKGNGKATNRKQKFIPPQLENIEREGTDFRLGRNISPEIWQHQFEFRGVEFGNWLSQKDRQASMNFCYEALLDLAEALDMDDKDITFGGRLALAFGARGTSGALAHYEPLREVINLTKMRGAGCTAHEWGHALDDYIGKCCGITTMGTNTLASENISRNADKLPESFIRLVKALKKDADGNYTDYYRGSARFDRHYAKDAHGYWSSNCEMFARAFACYVKDNRGLKSDYLYAHADVYTFEYDNENVCAHPQDEERELFDELFDQLFYDLKEMGFLHRRPKKEVKPNSPRYSLDTIPLDIVYEEEDGGQLKLAFG